jgi:hypothetical protein
MPDRAPSDPTDEVLEYPHEWQTYRFLFSDGKTVDVRAIGDSSQVRGWVLDQMTARMDVTDKDLRIEGVAHV